MDLTVCGVIDCMGLNSYSVIAQADEFCASYLTSLYLNLLIYKLSMTVISIS